jgi:hypothetical protein
LKVDGTLGRAVPHSTLAKRASRWRQLARITTPSRRVSQLVVGFTLKGDDRDMRPEPGPLQTMCQGSIKVASITLSTMATPTPSPAGTPTFDLSILGIAGSDWRIAHCG